jgi:hypothetical protein
MMGRLWSTVTSLHARFEGGACEELTWETCPTCGGVAAVGREPVGPQLEVRFDCSAGCAVRPELIAAAFG